VPKIYTLDTGNKCLVSNVYIFWHIQGASLHPCFQKLTDLIL